jgi:hypothetical protein
MAPASLVPTRRSLLATAATLGAVGSILRATPGYAQTVAAAGGNAIRPFHVSVPEEKLVELRRLIAATRWPENETVAGAAPRDPRRPM